MTDCYIKILGGSGLCGLCRVPVFLEALLRKKNETPIDKHCRSGGAFPAVNAFWSITMYGGNQYLVANPINRYLINSPMLPNLKKGADGSLTMYIQNASPGPKLQSNWLPARPGPFFMQMRLYWPKQAAVDGLWKTAPVGRVE